MVAGQPHQRKQAGTAITLVGNRTKQRARLHGGGWLDDLEARLRRGRLMIVASRPEKPHSRPNVCSPDGLN